MCFLFRNCDLAGFSESALELDTAFGVVSVFLMHDFRTYESFLEPFFIGAADSSLLSALDFAFDF